MRMTMVTTRMCSPRSVLVHPTLMTRTSSFRGGIMSRSETKPEVAREGFELESIEERS
jgi:hypothetical protein